MSDTSVQSEKLGAGVKRSARSKWAESVEELIRPVFPFPASYDVTTVQGENFSEYGYTEFVNGLWLYTLSGEINARLINMASEEHLPVELDKFTASICDKYEQNTNDSNVVYNKVCFLPGHNMLHCADKKYIRRLVFENDDIFFKLHPLTDENHVDIIARVVGWNRIIDKGISALSVLKKCNDVYTTSASEMCITATALGKKVINISDFDYEGSGAYYPISRILFNAHNTGIAYAQQRLSNIINSKSSGILFPWHEDIAYRAKRYFKLTLDMRKYFKPLVMPIMSRARSDEGKK